MYDNNVDKIYSLFCPADLKNLLLNSGNSLIAESSLDPYWGTGVHLHDRVVLDQKYWKNQSGAMSEILQEVRQGLRSA